uniref:3-ketoacyl-CoA thiolase n=1 Tax=Mycena chlorophos TaxID=658473 RepID=A0ABQ0KZP5_MYCCL|nr:3-ketoacyl-CoA thiolase [Mycena chlorophos]
MAPTTSLRSSPRAPCVPSPMEDTLIIRTTPSNRPRGAQEEGVAFTESHAGSEQRAGGQAEHCQLPRMRCPEAGAPLVSSFIIARPATTFMRSASSAAPRGMQAILQKSPDDVVFTFAKRSAMGRVKKGQLKDTTVDELLQALFKATLEKTKLSPAAIDDICVGTCHPPSPLYVSRAAALAAGIPDHVPVSTVNRLCSSGLMAIRSIAHAIQAGETSIGLAVGIESTTMHPRPTPQVSEVVDSNTQAHDCIQPMGWTSEMVAETYKVSREKQDQYALISHTRANEALAKGIFADEILPLELKGQVVSVDDTIRPGVTAQGLAALKPAFPQWGPASTTAGNASGIGDGAAICVMMTRARAEQEGFEILGKWVGSSLVGVEPRHMGIAPIYAIPKVLEQVGLKKEDIDLYEINEAFASQFAYCVEQLGVPMEKINPNGGAIAISHPMGMTGVRQVVTGLAEMKRTGKSVLCTSMCVGSGMGAASIIVNEARAGSKL